MSSLVEIALVVMVSLKWLLLLKLRKQWSFFIERKLMGEQ